MSKLHELLQQKKEPVVQPQKQQQSKPVQQPNNKLTAALTEAANKKPAKLSVGKPAATKPAVDKHAAIDNIANMELELRTDVADWDNNPDREIDKGDLLQAQLIAQLEKLREVLVTDDVSGVLHECLKFIHENPATKELLLPDDVGMLVQALQSSHGVVISKKSERKQSKKKTDEKVDDILDRLAAEGFSLT